MDPEITETKITEAQSYNNLEEIINFLHVECAKHPQWSELDDFNKKCLIDQAFIMYFLDEKAVPAKIQLGAALAAIAEDPWFLGKSVVERDEIIADIKRVGMKIKQRKNAQGNEFFSLTQVESLPLKGLIDKGLNISIVEILLGDELLGKLLKRWNRKDQGE